MKVQIEDAKNGYPQLIMSKMNRVGVDTRHLRHRHRMNYPLENDVSISSKRQRRSIIDRRKKMSFRIDDSMMMDMEKQKSIDLRHRRMKTLLRTHSELPVEKFQIHIFNNKLEKISSNVFLSKKCNLSTKFRGHVDKKQIYKPKSRIS